jgi:hypothetical protein
MRAWIDPAMPQSRDVKENMATPVIKTFFLPIMSAYLPKGSRNAAEAMEGIARFTALPIKGVKKEAIVTVINAYFLIDAS